MNRLQPIIIKEIGFLLCFIIIGYVAAGQTPAPSNLKKYLNEEKWNDLFPNRFDLSDDAQRPLITKKSDFFSFKAFAAAADSFPIFLSATDTANQKRELAAFLASIAFETSGGWDAAPGGYYKWGLYFTEERGCSNGCPQYTDTIRIKYPPVAEQSYHGRGPLQISWNYNYGQFSEMYLHDKDRLLKDPGLLTKDPVISFASALWFWTTAQFPKPSCHEIITGKWIPSAKDTAGGRLPGFGSVVNVINGGVECNASSGNTKYRYNYYRYFCDYLKVNPGTSIECGARSPLANKTEVKKIAIDESLTNVC